MRDRLRDLGCPFDAESRDAVIWLHGYNAGASAMIVERMWHGPEGVC